VRSDSSGHAHERFVPQGKRGCCEDLQVAAHSGHHQITQIPVRLMPCGAQLIHVAEGEKEASFDRPKLLILNGLKWILKPALVTIFQSIHRRFKVVFANPPA